MNTTRASGIALAKAIAGCEATCSGKVDVLVCPPAPYLIPVVEAVSGTNLIVGAQNASFETPGAFTGELALEMVLDTGCQSVLIGHSERRHIYGETNEIINKKVKTTLAKGLQAVLCVGELIEERRADKTEAVLDAQMEGGLQDVSSADMAHVVIAYEPVWAIGTGETASPEQAESAHAHLRKWLESRYSSDVANATRILYGGSVKPSNADELLSQPNVDGALVGGASLTPENFIPIIEAGVKAS